MKNLNELTVKEVLSGLQKKEFSSTEVTKACLGMIEKKDREIKAFITVTKDRALADAKKTDEIIKREGKSAFEKYPLLGVPFAVKDNFCTKGILTTAASNVIRNFIPSYESTVTKRLGEAGAVLLGKTNMDAFAHGASTEESDFFTTKNPHDLGRLPGGSSGGSAAAVASNMCIFAIGSDTGGSIRHPASWCGVVGLKPTYGRVSRNGLIAMASSTDSPGPLTKSVYDCAIVLKVISGKDQLDSTTVEVVVPNFEDTLKTKRKLKIGVAKSYFVKGMENGVKKSVLNAVDLLKKGGFDVTEIDLLDPKYSVAVYTIIQRSEVSSNLSRFDGIRYGFPRSEFGFEAKKRIMLGTYTLSVGYYDKYYIKAQRVRSLIVNDFNRAFSNVDVIVGPTTPNVALKIGVGKNSSMFGELQDILSEPASMAGLVDITIPCGFNNGLPVGFKIIGDRFQEKKVFSLASHLERLINGII